MYQLGQISGAAVLDINPFQDPLKRLVSMARGAGGMIAGYLSIKALTDFASGSYSMFSEAQSAEMGLASVLKSNGEQVSANMARFKAFASELQKVTEYGDDETLAIMKRGLAYRIEADRIEETTKAAMGLAARYDRDVNDAMMLIGKAQSGNTRALSQWGIVLDESLSKEEKFNAVLKLGADSFGMVTDKMKMNKGIMTQLNNYWGDFREGVGQLITYMFDLDKPFTSLISLLESVTTTITTNAPTWAYGFQVFYFEIEAGVKKIWATVGPVITLIGEWIVAGFRNISVYMDWFSSNWTILWDNAGSVTIAFLEDFAQYQTAIFRIIIKSGIEYYKAFWKVISGGGIEAFSQMFENIKTAIADEVGSIGKKTELAFAKIGVSPLPALESADYAGFVEKYKNYSATLEQIDKEKADKEANAFKNAQGRINSREAAGKTSATPKETTVDFVRKLSSAELAGSAAAYKTINNARLETIQVRQLNVSEQQLTATKDVAKNTAGLQDVGEI